MGSGPLPAHRGIFWFWLHFLDGQHACVGAGTPNQLSWGFTPMSICLSRIAPMA